jgi:hypothetical protein
MDRPFDRPLHLSNGIPVITVASITDYRNVRKTCLTDLRQLLDSLTALLHQFEIPTHRDGVPAVLITEVEALHLRIPIVRQVADGTQDVLLVRIATDAGHVGYGEVVSSSYIGRAVIEAPMSAPRRHGLAAALVGKDPLDPPSALERHVRGKSLVRAGRRRVARHQRSRHRAVGYRWQGARKVHRRPLGTEA